MRRNRFLYLILPILTIILEILPYGAVLHFANPEGKPWRHTFSYFSLTPYAYAEFAPFITAMITCIIVAVLVIYCIAGTDRVVRTAKSLLCVCTVCSLGSLVPSVLGGHRPSVVGILIAISLIAEWIILHFATKGSKTDNASPT